MDNIVSVTLMTINYSHDIATALLAASGAAFWLLSRRYPDPASTEAELYFIRMFRSITTLAKYSLVWILLAGVPRIIVYKEYEWASSAGDLQVVAIVIKHVVMFLLVGTGFYYWATLSKKAQKLGLRNSL